MHYYKFHISDWHLHTSHLTPEEEGIYLRLVNYYYDTEAPIPAETKAVIRRLRLGSCLDKVRLILDEYFVLNDDGWTHKRCETELTEYKSRADTYRANGRRGGRPRKNKENKKPKITKAVSKNNQSANLTTNHKPLSIIGGKFVPPSATEVAEYAKSKQIKIDAQHFVDHYQTNGWMRGKNKIKDWKACVRTWGRNTSTMQNQQQPQQRPLIKSNLNEILR